MATLYCTTCDIILEDREYDGKTNEGDPQYAMERGTSEKGDKYQYEPQFVTELLPR